MDTWAEFRERAGGLERQTERDLAAYHAISPGFQGRRSLECGGKHPRRTPGHRIRPAGAVLCGGRGQDLRQLCGGKTLLENINRYPVLAYGLTAMGRRFFISSGNFTE